MGFLEKTSFYYHIFILCKQVISQCRCLNIKLSLSSLKARIKTTYKLELSIAKQHKKLKFKTSEQKKNGQIELHPVVHLFHFIFHLLSSPVCLITRGNLYLKYHFLPLQTPLPSCNLLDPIPSIRQLKT